MKPKHLLTYFIALALVSFSIMIIEVSPIMAKPTPQTARNRSTIKDSSATPQPQETVDNTNIVVTPSPVGEVKIPPKPSNDFPLLPWIFGSLSVLLHFLEIAGMGWAYLKIGQLSEKVIDSKGQIKNLTGKINAYEQKQKSQGDQLKVIGSDAASTRNLASRLNEIELAAQQKSHEVSYSNSSYSNQPIAQPVKSSITTSSAYLFLNTYQIGPENFKNQYMPKIVSEDAENVQERRSGSQQDIILSEDRQGKYWLFNEGSQIYLVPNPKLKVNSINIQIAESIFDCESYTPGCQHISVVSPAIVSYYLGSNERWKLERKGVLGFT